MHADLSVRPSDATGMTDAPDGNIQVDVFLGGALARVFGYRTRAAREVNPRHQDLRGELIASRSRWSRMPRAGNDIAQTI
jgi:hypothetical protein